MEDHGLIGVSIIIPALIILKGYRTCGRMQSNTIARWDTMYFGPFALEKLTYAGLRFDQICSVVSPSMLKQIRRDLKNESAMVNGLVGRYYLHMLSNSFRFLKVGIFSWFF